MDFHRRRELAAVAETRVNVSIRSFFHKALALLWKHCSQVELCEFDWIASHFEPRLHLLIFFFFFSRVMRLLLPMTHSDY